MLSKQKIERINELARKSKQSSLSAAEQKEQEQLRQEYLASVRKSMKANLMNMTVIDPEGKDVTPRKLKKEQRRNRKH